MASPSLLERLLNTPDLAKVVPLLPPDVLHRVIQNCGLEDAAEFVALATPEQLSRVLDVDVWRVATAGADEQLDVDRFGVWLDVLMQSGAAVAAEKLIGLDRALVVAGFSRHIAVFDQAAIAAYTTLDGQHVPGRVPHVGPATKIGSYAIEARRTSAWEPIADLLAYLRLAHPDYFERLMRSCVRLSDGPREADGFHTLLDDREQDMFDLAADREARREPLGYLPAAQARAFMQAARHTKSEGARPPDDPVARAYFRGLEVDQPAPADASGPPSLLPEGSAPDGNAPIDLAAMAAVVEVLRDAGVLTEEPRGLLPSAGGEAGRLAFVEDHVASHAASPAELAFLANALVAGCSIQARPFTVQEASNAAAAVCNLGLEAWPPHWNNKELVTAFQVGWSILHRDVSMYSAERLIAVIAGVRSLDRDINMRLRGLRRELVKGVRGGTPWDARDDLDVIVMLDGPSWAGLLALTDECPVLHAAIRASRDHSLSINPSDYEFISQRSQIALVREFMESLAARLKP